MATQEHLHNQQEHQQQEAMHFHQQQQQQQQAQAQLTQRAVNDVCKPRPKPEPEASPIPNTGSGMSAFMRAIEGAPANDTDAAVTSAVREDLDKHQLEKLVREQQVRLEKFERAHQQKL